MSGELYFAPGRLLAKLNDTLGDFCDRSTPVLDLSAASLPLQAIVSCKCQQSTVISLTDKEACRSTTTEDNQENLEGCTCFTDVPAI